MVSIYFSVPIVPQVPDLAFMACSCYGLSATVRFLGRNFGVYGVVLRGQPVT